MNREEFIKKSLLLGIGVTFFPSVFSACQKKDDSHAARLHYDGEVLIIGAGAAGLMAAYRLALNQINFRILEASPHFGGRVKKTQDFADFPIDLGAEWIHDEPTVFRDMIGNDQVQGSIDLIPYNPREIKSWSNGKLHNHSFFSTFYREYKFKNTTWYDFFEDFIVPTIGLDNMVFNSPVNKIDYGGSRVRVTTTDGQVYEADKVLVTASVNVIKDGLIDFAPALPQAKIDALDTFIMPDGLKVFIQFSERFYPDVLLMQGLSSILSSESEEKIYYDAAFKKNSSQNILGLFTVGPVASPFTGMDTEQELIGAILAELDEIFKGKASQTYQKHIIQNWSKEAYVRGSYNFEGTAGAASEMLKGVDDKLYFAGEAFSNSAPATVHGAGLCGFDQMEELVR